MAETSTLLLKGGQARISLSISDYWGCDPYCLYCVGSMFWQLVRQRAQSCKVVAQLCKMSGHECMNGSNCHGRRAQAMRYTILWVAECLIIATAILDPYEWTITTGKGSFNWYHSSTEDYTGTSVMSQLVMSMTSLNINCWSGNVLVQILRDLKITVIMGKKFLPILTRTCSYTTASSCTSRMPILNDMFTDHLKFINRGR